jgi:hypothetical protein
MPWPANDMDHRATLETTSALKGKVAERGGGKPEDARLSAVYERMMSELNAHAVQAAHARELRASGRRLTQTDELLADSFTMTDFEPPRGVMFRKLVEYAKRYTGGTSDRIAEQQVIEMVMLSWGDIEALVAKSEKDPGRVGLNDADEIAYKRPAESDDEDVEEIIASWRQRGADHWHAA